MILSGPGRSGGDEPGVEAIGGCVHKRCALNTRLSSGNSAGTFAVSAGPYRNYQAEAGRKISLTNVEHRQLLHANSPVSARGVSARVQGLPISNCAGSCNNLVPRGTKVSAIDVTQKVFFQCLY